MTTPLPTVPSVESCGSALELIDALRPTHPRWRTHPGRWIFRGQGDSRWELRPSAFRPGAWRAFMPLADPDFKVEAHGTTLPLEFRVLERFLNGLDSSGLDVPEGTWVRERLNVGPTEFFRFPLHSAVVTFLALAQHHGIPTRLLDWTRVGLNAAYFAAAEAAKQHDKASGFMSVWALEPSFGERCEELLLEKRISTIKLRVATAPRASNPNLHAQFGVFTEVSEADPVERVVSELLSMLREVRLPIPADSPLLRFDLPLSESPRLLRLLADEQIDGARMFPGREGVVRALKERLLWDGL